MLIPIVQKGKKFVNFALISTYGLTKEGVNGMVDEKVTVISSVVHTYIRTYQAKLEVGNGISANFFVTEEAGNALAALGNIHEDDGHILK